MSSRARARSLSFSLVYIRSLPSSRPTSSSLSPPGCQGRYREGVEPGTYREEPSRDISIATRLRVRDKPDPHSAGCRSRPSTVQHSRSPPPPHPAPPHPLTPPRRRSFETSSEQDWGRRRGTTAIPTSRPMIKTRRITADIAAFLPPSYPSIVLQVLLHLARESSGPSSKPDRAPADERFARSPPSRAVSLAWSNVITSFFPSSGDCCRVGEKMSLRGTDKRWRRFRIITIHMCRDYVNLNSSRTVYAIINVRKSA